MQSKMPFKIIHCSMCNNRHARIILCSYPLRKVLCAVLLSDYQSSRLLRNPLLVTCCRSSVSQLLHREVVQLVTPGTLLEPLTQQANFLLSVAVGPGGSLGLAWLDLSTSQFKVGGVGVGSTCTNEAYAAYRLA